MNQPIKEKTPGKPRILVAPLDWGLGHVTRCIPIIKELITHNCDVWLAGEYAQEQLLKTEFPELPFLKLKGYRIKYAKTKKGLIWKMLKQGPKLKKAIRFEHKWLKNAVEEFGFDAIISDNRYGMYHSKVPGIFITHQLRIKSAAGKWTEKIIQKRLYSYINKFSECWIPDFESDNNLAGELSHPEIKPSIPSYFIGSLSRFKRNRSVNDKSNIVKPGHILIALSGPEPQRSILEAIIIEEVSHYNGTATVVRGLPGNATITPSTNMIKFYNHLSALELMIEIQKAEYVICRSGYSSIMDIATLQKKSILIPTPGQTEQEYLGEYLESRGFAIYINQSEFSLSKALSAAAKFEYKNYEINSDQLLKKRIDQMLKGLS